MSRFNLSAIVTAFEIGIRLLTQFNQDISVPKWLAPFGLAGLLALLTVIWPWMQKGSVLALLIGYLTMGFLIINLLILFALAQLPGQAVKLSSASDRAGKLLLEMLGAGLGVMLKSSVSAVVQGAVQIKAVVLKTIQQKSKATPLQKLLGSSVAWG
ncbi:MAG: hypothetical protein KME35_02225 [Aphanocapsa sp. GSE-SYN-MK-11-07L]|jgi:uncharacterized membrane protein|nr:hypothetical protein [Aphanocapsa sp. GSE-SYN-MK-11-07L]